MFTAPIAITLTEEQLTRFTGYPVTLPVFEGPLDLLLYLIRRQELDIYDIPIASITEQFLEYMALMEAMDIELAADFLVMAATLMEIKSRMLLPCPPVMVEEEDEEEDPRAELVRKLLEYKRYKSAATELHRRVGEQSRLFGRTSIVPNLPLPRPEPTIVGNPDAFSLWQALQEVLARVEAMGPAVREVARPKITIRQQMLLLLNLLAAHPAGIAFAELFFYEGRDTIPTRVEVIITFLALLELMRLHRVIVVQSELFGEITLRAANAEALAAG